MRGQFRRNTQPSPQPPKHPQKYTFLRGFEPNKGGFHPKRTRILHGNCTVIARLLLGWEPPGLKDRGELVGGKMGQMGIFQNRN